MKNLFYPFIQKQGVAILDGALATELEARGADLNHGLWSAKLLKENPALIQNVHYDYLLAGADIITTASYQASFESFAKQNYTHKESVELLQLSVQLAINAREAIKKKYPTKIDAIIAASIGAYGASLADGSEYKGNYGVSINVLKDFHRKQITILSATKADILAFETIPCKDEAVAIIEVLKEFPNTKAWVSFSCKNEVNVCSGETLAACVEVINQSAQVIAVGVNCTAPEFVKNLIKMIANTSKKEIIVYPNKGELWDAQNKCWSSTNNNNLTFIEFAKLWHQAGAKIIGGCCQTNPTDINQLQSLFNI